MKFQWKDCIAKIDHVVLTVWSEQVFWRWDAVYISDSSLKWECSCAGYELNKESAQAAAEKAIQQMLSELGVQL